jgi:DNA-binding NarL/FixJ family response regulator
MLTTLKQTGPFMGGGTNGVGKPLAPHTQVVSPVRPSFPTISVIDDDEALHEFLRALGQDHFKVIGSFYNAAQALERLPQQPPDAVIMDLRLPDLSGLDCTSKLKTIMPSLPVIILTGYPDSRNFFQSLMEGAGGYLVKPVLPQEFLDAIDEVLKGQFALAKQAVPYLLQLVHHVGRVVRGSALTRREEEIMACLFEGLQDKEIASALGIGTATVHTHMHKLFEKLGVHSRRDVIARYLALS